VFRASANSIADISDYSLQIHVKVSEMVEYYGICLKNGRILWKLQKSIDEN